jgi:hypothetical protein
MSLPCGWISFLSAATFKKSRNAENPNDFMPTLLLRFAIVLENSAIEPYDRLSGERRHGPLFHKWLPDGEQDSIELNVDEPEAELRVWFEQNGFIENGRVRFDYERQELDATIISQHPILDAGPLIGTLKLPNVPEDAFESIQENRVGDPAYVAFGRRVAHLIYEPVARLIDVLRTNYGQYWINPLKEWNPRGQSLGSYFSLVIQTKWSVDDGVNWSDFLPDNPELLPTTDGSAETYEALLTQQDWRELQKHLSEGYEPKLAAELVTTTHQLIERQDLRGAVLQTMLALEVALNEFMNRKMRMNKVLADNLHGWSSLTLPARLAAVATLSGAVTASQVESALKLSEMSHKIIREGWIPPFTAQEELRHVVQTVAALLSGPTFKFPNYYTESPVVDVLEAPAAPAEEPATEEPSTEAVPQAS